MNRYVRFLLTVSIPGLLLMLLGGAALSLQQMPKDTTQTATAEPQRLTPLTLALDWIPGAVHTGIYVAQQKGWYRSQGLALKVLPFSSSMAPPTLVNMEMADVAFSSLEGVVAYQALGQTAISIAAIIQHDTSALATRTDAGITHLRDLDGKIYGGFGAPFEKGVVSTLLRRNGGQGSFQYVGLDTAALDALNAGRIDFTWILQGEDDIQAQFANIKLRLFPMTTYGIPDHPSLCLITGPKQIQQKASLLRKFLVATTQGYEYARQHPIESAHLLIEAAGKENFPNPDFVIASQKFYSQRYADPGQRWGRQEAKAWNDYVLFLLQSDAITDAAGKPIKSVTSTTLYSNEFLP